MSSNLQTINDHRSSTDSMDEAFTQLYPEIKKIAQAQLNRLKPGQTITATVLVNECYLKLQHKIKQQLLSEKHFFCLIARCMKHHLIDEIRTKSRSKRNAALQTSLITQMIGTERINTQLMEVIRALDKLAIIDPDSAELVNLHCFGGFTFDELSHVMQLSKRQLIRRWQVAKTLMVTFLDENHEQ